MHSKTIARATISHLKSLRVPGGRGIFPDPGGNRYDMDTLADLLDSHLPGHFDIIAEGWSFPETNSDPQPVELSGNTQPTRQVQRPSARAMTQP